MVHEFQQSGCLFVSQRTGSHSAGIRVPLTNCFVCRWFCVVHDPLHSHNWLSFGKFQDTKRFLIHCERHFSSWLPPSGGTWKYAKASSTKKKLGEILYVLICSFLPYLSWLLRSRVRKSRRDLWITLYYDNKHLDYINSGEVTDQLRDYTLIKRTLFRKVNYMCWLRQSIS